MSGQGHLMDPSSQMQSGSSQPPLWYRGPSILQVCILAVPKFVAFRAGADEVAHLQAVGYRVTSDEGDPVQLEGTDDFVTRMQARMRVRVRNEGIK